jgi:hypothetical protein
MTQNVIRASGLLDLLLVAVVATAQSNSSLPDVVGIRPGIAAQDAYNLLKARNPSVKVGVGQVPIQGFGDAPVSTAISAQVIDARAPEIITVWLTTPPSKQVVFSVGRTLEYPRDKALLRTNVVENLRQKYGPETDQENGRYFWAFDENGNRLDAAQERSQNCKARVPFNTPVAAPDASTYPQPTPLIYSPQPATPCDANVGVWASLDVPSDAPGELVTRITVQITDLALARRSQIAYQNYLKNGAAAQNKEELDKAKQRKGPIF